MKQILCFGDSNTYGFIPANGKRYPFGVRWTSVLAKKLGFDEYNVIEEGLCGRTTIFEDPIAYRKIAEEEGTFFLDASTVAEPCEDENEHLNEEGHKALAEAVYAEITEKILRK